MEKKEMLYEGKAKKVYATDVEDVYIVDYKDDATAFNGEKKGTIVGKGVVNNKVSNHMFKMLEKEGIIGSVYPALISTTGNSTSVADSTRMGQEIAERLVSAGVNGVILTST